MGRPVMLSTAAPSGDDGDGPSKLLGAGVDPRSKDDAIVMSPPPPPLRLSSSDEDNGSWYSSSPSPPRNENDDDDNHQDDAAFVNNRDEQLEKKAGLSTTDMNLPAYSNSSSSNYNYSAHHQHQGDDKEPPFVASDKVEWSPPRSPTTTGHRHHHPQASSATTAASNASIATRSPRVCDDDDDDDDNYSSFATVHDYDKDILGALPSPVNRKSALTATTATTSSGNAAPPTTPLLERKEEYISRVDRANSKVRNNDGNEDDWHVIDQHLAYCKSLDPYVRDGLMQVRTPGEMKKDGGVVVRASSSSSWNDGGGGATNTCHGTPAALDSARTSAPPPEGIIDAPEDELWTATEGDHEHNAKNNDRRLEPKLTVDTEMSTYHTALPVDDDIAPDDDDDDEEGNNKYSRYEHSKFHRRTRFMSALLFVLGSILYLILAVEDYRWARTLGTLPMWLRVADDDAAWTSYRLGERYDGEEEEQQQQQSEGLSSVADGGMGGGGVRRMLMREEKDATAYDNEVPSNERQKGRLRNLRAEDDMDDVVTREAALAPSSPTPVELYCDMCWAELPPNVQDAYALLGFDENMWDNAIAPEYEDYDWIELSDEQRDAALSIGYTEAMWCELGCDAWLNGEEDEEESAVFEDGKKDEEEEEEKEVQSTALEVSQQTGEKEEEGQVLDDNKEEGGGGTAIMESTSGAVEGDENVPQEDTESLWLDWRPYGEEDQVAKEEEEATTSTLELGTPVEGGPVPEMPTTQESEESQPSSAVVSGIVVDESDEQEESSSVTTPKEPSTAAENGIVTDDTTGEADPSSVLFTCASSSSLPPILPTPVELYYDMCWAELPPDVQDAYALLGFDENMWDNAIAPEYEDYDWIELSDEQRDAALSIGYTEAMWCELGCNACLNGEEEEVSSGAAAGDAALALPSPSEADQSGIIPSPASPLAASVSLAGGETMTTTPLVQSPLQPQTNPTVLGEPSTAAENGIVIDDTTGEADPSSVLFTCASSLSSPPLQPTPEELYYEMCWAELPPDIQIDYALLGFNENMWDNAIAPEYEDYDWIELSDEQRDAALSIGYTEAMWCELGCNACLSGEEEEVSSGVAGDASLALYGAESSSALQFVLPPGTIYDIANNSALPKDSLMGDATAGAPTTVAAGYYDDYDWVELSPHIQDAAVALGYDQKLWDMGGVAWSEDSWWHELPAEAQVAAARLGYDKQSWDTAEGSTVAAAAGAYESYDDDYVFQVGSSGDVWVSRYQILFFFAALCFVGVGVLDLLRERHAFHTLMILAGVFGVVSAVYVEEDIRLSNIFNCVSVHLFLFEAVTLFGEHKRSAISSEAPKWVKRCGVLGDLEFIVGAFVDVILSYIYLFDNTADWDFSLMIASIVAAVLWLHCSLIYMGSFFYYRSVDLNPIGQDQSLAFGV